jgi:dienelactone hydrolase
MVVQTGEGTTDIIYGTTSIPAGPRTFGGYLARPDGVGEWPTVLVYGPAAIPSSTVKNFCRVLARHGIAALAPELGSDAERNRHESLAIAGFITNPAGDWSNAEYGYGVVAFESGLRDAAALTASDPGVVAVAAVGATIDEEVEADLALADVPMLFIGSRGDEAADVEVSLGTRERLPQTTFVIYGDGDTGFWNDDAPGFRQDRFDDTVRRLVAFLTDRLPARA